MRKCRRLVDKIGLCCLSVLLAFSTFFHFTSCAFASESVMVSETATLSDISPADVESMDFNISEDFSMSSEKLWGASESFSTSKFDLVSSSMQDDAVYKVKVGFNARVSSEQMFNMYHTHVKYGNLSINFFDRYTNGDLHGLYFSGYNDVIGYGREFKNNALTVSSYFVSNVQGGVVQYDMSIDIDVADVEVVSLPNLFDDGYTNGYQAAVDQYVTESAETFEVNKSFDIAFDGSTFNDSNTMLPTVFEQEYDLEGIMNTNAFYYYATMPQFVFTPSKEYYGYKVELVPMGISYSGNGMVEWVRPCVGSVNDIYKGTSQMGRDLNLYSNHTANLWIDTAYSEEDIYFSFLCYFRESLKLSAVKPEGGVSGKYLIRITPYSFDTYEQATINAQNQSNQLAQQGNQIAQETQNDMNQNFNDLMNGYYNGSTDYTQNALDHSLGTLTENDSALLNSVTGSVDYNKMDSLEGIMADWSQFGLLGSITFISTLLTALFNSNELIPLVFYIIIGVSLCALAIGLSKYFTKDGED